MKNDKQEIILYQTEDGKTKLDVKFSGETLWLTQAQLDELFQTTPQNITLHIKSIYEEGELLQEATCKKCLQVQNEGNRQISRNLTHFNLEIILAIGYRVRSLRGTQFRQWATEILAEYVQKGFALNDDLLKAAGGGGYWKELLAQENLHRITHISTNLVCGLYFLCDFASWRDIFFFLQRHRRKLRKKRRSDRCENGT